MRRFKLPPQILRLVLLTLAIVGSYLIARVLLTPASFGEYGWYRGAALAELRRGPGLRGQAGLRGMPFGRVSETHKYEHKTLSCEACHGASREHADNPDINARQLTDSLCLRCHEANPSRPKWHKQIVIKNHYTGKCTECHVPHSPPEAHEKPVPGAVHCQDRRGDGRRARPSAARGGQGGGAKSVCVLADAPKDYDPTQHKWVDGH